MSAVTIEGETWRAELSEAEYQAWDQYAEAHPWLFAIGYGPILRMFLAHYRRGLNLNDFRA